MLSYYILASGSSGNATLVTNGETTIVIDMGLTLSEFRARLKQTPIKEEYINAVLYSHGHGDHYNPLKSIPINKIYATKATLNLTNGNSLEFYKTYKIGTLEILVLPTSHDYKDSVGFIVTSKEESLLYMTDTGYISEYNLSFMKNLTYYIIESNHDVRMLLATNRPYELIMRIMGDEGHLSNEDSAMYMSEVVGDNTKEIVLAHLSEEANTPSKALIAYETMFNQKRINTKDIKIKCAHQHKVVNGGHNAH